jgi:RNA polymerase sigma-70 factor (ECF subfamily)
MMAIPSDEFLLAATSKGDREAFDQLSARYSDVLDGFFRRRLPDDGRVEELRQETLLALYSLLPSYKEQGKFRTLLFSIAYRKLASLLRAEKPTEQLADNLPARNADPDSFEVRDAVLALPVGLREALLLTRFEGLPAADAGDLLGCSAEAVRARVCRAKTLLASKFVSPTRRKP